MLLSFQINIFSIMIHLAPISEISVTLIMDNVTDRLLSNSLHAYRLPLGKDEKILPAPIAEHGFSALVEIQYENTDAENGSHQKNKKTYLFDTGTSENGVIINSDLFELNLKYVDAIVLSHGHFDHVSGLQSVLKRISRPVKLYLHSDAFLKRWIVFPDGTRLLLPILEQSALIKQNAIVKKNEMPTGLPDEEENSRLIISGQIPRETSYEKGFPPQYAEIEGKGLIHDPLVKDDQALIANVEGKGLVIITGCGHSGIINTINHAKTLVGVEKIHAVLGGFHLSGPLYENVIEPTLSDLQAANPDFVIPCHCTGWKAINAIIQRMPEKFIQPSVGTRFVFSEMM